MNVYRSNYISTALIISILIHGILVFLLLSAIIVQLMNSTGKNRSLGAPAPVTMRWGDGASSKTLPGNETSPDDFPTAIEPLDETLDESVIEPQVPQKIQVPDYASGTLAIPMEHIQPEKQPQKTEETLAPTSTQPIAVKKVARKKRRRRAAPRTNTPMSPGQLFNAFNQSVQKSLTGMYGDPRGSVHGNSDDGLTDSQRYAVARARELGDYRFRGRIDDVLERTFAIYAQEMYFDEDIETPVKIEVMINPDGTISQVSFDKATNSKMVNDEIKRVLLMTENIPVPSRFSKQPYTYTIEGMAHISKGKGKMRYIPKPKSDSSHDYI